MKDLATKLMGTALSLLGAYLLFKGDSVNGLLALILGEIVILPYRLPTHNK